MEQLVRAATPAAQEAGGGVFSLPPVMVDRATARLCMVSIACASTSVVYFLLDRWMQPEFAAARHHNLAALNLLAVFLFSVALVAAQRLKLLPPLHILHLGLAFSVLVAWCIAFFETVLPMDPTSVVRGSTLVAVWLAFVTMLVRHTPVVTLLVGLLAASMWPLAYFVNLSLNGSAGLPPNRLMMWIFPAYLSAFWAYFMNRRIYQMEVQATRAEELGSYQLVYMIGQGGMGEVWRARHRLLARDAAIKLIRPELMQRNSARQADMMRRRFEREAKATSSLQCPHTIFLFDFGMAHNGSFYYVMELLNGVSLQTLVERFGPQPAPRVAYILRQVCLSLEEAHRRGLVHRDIKPTNIFICKVGMQRDYVKVLDFGLVKHIDPTESSLITQEGTSAGTPAYMAPESAMGLEKVDGRLDLYSLGCVAYYLLTGHIVFEESTSTATALAHVQKEPVPPSQRTELPLPDALEKAILQCLAKKPEDRPRSAQELGRMLEHCDGLAAWGDEQANEWWRTNLPEGATQQLQIELERTQHTPIRIS
jgi:serine/threonine-protein kinase